MRKEGLATMQNVKMQANMNKYLCIFKDFYLTILNFFRSYF